MTDEEISKIEKAISELDIAVGKLIVPAMENDLIKEAMEQVSNVSFALGNLL